MEILFSIATLAGMGYAVFVGVKWMLRAGHASQKHDRALSPTDLKVLEDTTARLMSDLRTAADECVARIELALAQAESRVQSLERQTMTQSCPADFATPTTPIEVPASPALENPYETIKPTESAAQIARQAGMTTGEVELLRGLRRITR